MRRLGLSLVLLIAGAGAVRAERVSPDTVPEDPNRGDFWRNIVEPHADEIQRIVATATQAIAQADQLALQDLDAKGIDVRIRSFSDAYGMLRYARKLSPENTQVLTLLGRAADESGKTRQAIEALQAAAQLLGPEKASMEVTGRLGLIYLRLGQLDDAVRWLRIAQGSILTPLGSQVLIGLASALAARGEMAAALDTLVGAIPQSQGYYSPEVALASFALIVFYDRDEQRSAAFEVVDRMQAVLQQQFGSQIQQSLSSMRYAPAEDQHYYQGLLYETVGDYTEARAEWVLYASAAGPYRARALEHVHDIDTQRKTKPGSHAQTPVMPVRHHRHVP